MVAALLIMATIKEIFLGIVSAVLELASVVWFSFYYISESVLLFFTPDFLRTQKSLKGKVVLVTGGAGGVGQELAIRLARLKARVVIWDVNEKGEN